MTRTTASGRMAHMRGVALDEAVTELGRTMRDPEARLRYVLEMFSTMEIDIIVGQLRGMPTDTDEPEAAVPSQPEEGK